MILTDKFDELSVPQTARESNRSPFDAFAALDDLMCVVEALCPVWPAKPINAGRGTYTL